MPNRTAFGSTFPRGTRGLTMIELLTVITFIGILAAMGISKLDWTQYRAGSMGRGVGAALSVAQRTAVSLQADVRVSVADSSRLQIHEDADNDGAVDTGERVTFHGLDHGFKIGIGSAPVIPSPVDGTQLTSFVFKRDGSSSRAGTIYIVSPKSDPTCHYCRASTIARATGRVTSYSYATGAWIRSN